MFRSIHHRLYAVAGLMLVLFLASYGELVVFLERFARASLQADRAVALERTINALKADFQETRFWEQAVLLRSRPAAEVHFDSVMRRVKVQLNQLDPASLETNLGGRINRLNSLLTDYERAFTSLRTGAPRDAAAIQASQQQFDKLSNALTQALTATARMAMATAQREMDAAHETFMLLGYTFLGSAALALIGVLVVFVVVADTIVRPIREMAGVVRQVKDGDHAARIPVSATREVAALSTAFNDMLDTVRAHEAKLVDYQHELEDKVKKLFVSETALRKHQAQLEELVQERTQALSEAVSRLQQEVRQREEIQGELVKARDLAETANRAKGEFLAVVSHEIRTPLNAILGFTDILLQTPLTPDQLSHMQTVRASGETLLTLLNEILDFSKIESGRFELEPHPVAIRQIVEEALDLLAGKVGAKPVELLFDVAPDVPVSVIADGPRLRQILLNLVDNSIKFTEVGEVLVTVTVDQGASPAAGPLECVLHICVKDTGIGIPAEKAARLFEPFSQADSSTTRKYGGTGLGLAICRRLCDLMGGSIWIADHAGPGAEFHFRVTVASSSIVPPHYMDADRSWPALKGRRILIVDDNPSCRRVLAEQCNRWHMVCVTAASAAEAETVLASQTGFAVCLADLVMPGKDGVALTASIRGQPRLDAVRVVLMVPLGVRDWERVSQQKLVDAVVPKPVHRAVLANALATTLAQTGAAGAPASPPVAEPVTDGSKGQPPAPPAGMRVLVAEDNLINQKLVAHLLVALGCQVDVAATGTAALEQLRQHPYDLVLMDLQMPVMDGLTATRNIRNGDAGEVNRNVCIVALTADAFMADHNRCLKVGMNHFLCKPFRKAELATILDRVRTAAR